MVAVIDRREAVVVMLVRVNAGSDAGQLQSTPAKIGPDPSIMA
jgi:hypothetical protein